MSRKIERRQFIRTTSAITLSTLSLGAVMSAKTEAAETENGADAVMMVPAASDLYRVRMEVSLEGNVDLPKDPLVSKKRDRRLPIKANSVIDYEERLTRDADASDIPAAAKRYYYTATNQTKVNGIQQSAELRKEAKRVIARTTVGPEILYGEKEYLTHEELELLQVPICSISIDSLLPTKAVSVGDKWMLTESDVARLLNLDGVQKTTIEGEVMSIDNQFVKMQLKGRADAAIGAVPTVIELAGKVSFDRKSAAITWIAMAIRETRNIGLAKPGFEIAATIKLIRQRLDEPNAVRDTEPVDLSTEAPRAKLLVNFDSQAGAFSTFMDRQWQTLNGAKGLTTMRKIVDEKAVSQCDIRELPRMKPGEQLTLEGFQNEIKKSLGDRFGEFAEAEEGLNGHELRTLRVVVLGSVQNVPVQWVFLHFSDDSGRRIGATFTLESSNVEFFAGSDAQLANSLRFTTPAKIEQAALPGSVLVK